MTIVGTADMGNILYWGIRSARTVRAQRAVCGEATRQHIQSVIHACLDYRMALHWTIMKSATVRLYIATGMLAYCI
jgi:hypothetical protein